MYRIIARIVAQKKILLLLFFAAAVCFLAQRPEQSKAAGSADSVSGPKVIVLNYHKVDHMNHSLSVQPPDFEQQMAFLKDNGYHTITPHEMYMAFTDGAPLPSNPVLITFDDGYADNYTYAYPMGKPGYLTWGQAAEMEASGVVSIESHTVNHGSLTELTDEQVRYELTEAKHDIEQRLGKEVEFLAYPTGAYNLHIASLVQEAGYKGAFTVRYGNMDRSANFYAIERVPIFHTSDTFASFLERLKFVPLFERIGWAKN